MIVEPHGWLRAQEKPLLGSLEGNRAIDGGRAGLLLSSVEKGRTSLSRRMFAHLFVGSRFVALGLPFALGKLLPGSVGALVAPRVRTARACGILAATRYCPKKACYQKWGPELTPWEF